MHTLVRIAGFVVALGWGAAPAARQMVVGTPGQGTRDPVRIVRPGTGSLKGQVVDGISGAPVARARVRLQGGPMSRPVTTTDANGAFVFTGLPAGQFILLAEKPTYQPAQYPEPGRTLRGTARSLVLGDGERRDDLVLRMYHGSAISGRVVDAYGDPVDYADVRLLRLTGPGGTPQMRGGGSTNDIGEFRIGRLDPGTYLLLAVPHRNMGADEPASDPPPPQPLATYFPGTPALDQAQSMLLGRGQSVSGIEVVIAEGVPAVVTGTVVGRDGQPVSGNAFVSARTVVTDMPGGFDGGGSPVRADGTFRLRVPPGEYQLEAHAMQPPKPGSNPPRPSNEMYGTLKLTVGEGLTEGVSIVVGAGATATGRIIFEGTSPPPPNPGQVRIPLFSSETGTCRPGEAQIAADWTFRVEGLAGSCTAAPPGGVDRWTLKAVLLEGDDLSYRTITFEPGQQIRNLQIVLTDRRSELVFHVSDEAGRPTREYAAIVFAEDKTRWTRSGQFVRSYVPPSQEVLNLRSSRSGRAAEAPGPPVTPAALRREFVSGLRPGDYYVIAVDDLESELIREPSVLERLSTAATRVTIVEGAAVDVNLRRVNASEVLGAR